MRTLGLLCVLTLAACQPAASLGASCSFTSECEALHLCRLGHCRVECASDADCPSGSSCLFGPDDVGGSCTLMVENTCTTTSCPSPLVCTPGGCRYPCGDGCHGGTVCTQGACVSVASDAGALDGASVDAGAAVDTGADAGP